MPYANAGSPIPLNLYETFTKITEHCRSGAVRGGAAIRCARFDASIAWLDRLTGPLSSRAGLRR
jgi:hypothetical protein